jgi:putative lipoic acid-binding regulatory protein
VETSCDARYIVMITLFQQFNTLRAPIWISSPPSTIQPKTDMSKQETPKIDYPCGWQYKIIGMNPEAMKQAVREIIADHDHTLDHSNSSSSGKYISFKLELEVHSEEHRDFFFLQLREHIAIKFVI